MASAAKKGKKVSWRRRAAWRLADLRRLSSVLRSNGEILDQNRWLDVLANTLGSAPEGPVTTRRGPDAPEVWRLDYLNLALAARRCEVEATQEQIEAVVKKTLALQEEAERSRAGRLLPMRPDEIARRLGVRADIRREARAWSIGATDETPAERTEAQRERDRLRKQDLRRNAGATPRAEYEAHSLSCTKPWEDLGVSRRTWERHRHAADVASPAVINKVSQVRPSQVRRGPIVDRVASPSAPNTFDTTPAAFAARGNRRKAPSDRKIGKGSPKKKVKSSVLNKARHRGSPRAEYHHPPGGLGMIAAARVERPRVSSATWPDAAGGRLDTAPADDIPLAPFDEAAPDEPCDVDAFGFAGDNEVMAREVAEPILSQQASERAAEPLDGHMAAEPRLELAYPATPLAKPALDQPAKAGTIAEPAPLAALDGDEASPVAKGIRRQLANLISLPAGRGFKARRDPPAAIGLTDRFCAACGDYASNEWPLPGGGRDWRCPDCAPLPAPGHVEAGRGPLPARSAA